MKNLYLCFFGDGPLFDNVRRVVAYPSGFSYSRPFRYRDKWVHPELLGEIQDPVACKALIGADATLGIRFISDAHRHLVLPVRKVRITHLHSEDGHYMVYFTLGEMLNFGAAHSLRQICIDIPPHELRAEDDQPLFFRSSVGPSGHFVTGDQEDIAWSSYCDLVAKSQPDSLPIHQNARNSLFLRLCSPEPEDQLAIGKIHDSKKEGERRGFVLAEGRSYELGLVHRVPALIGTHTTAGSIPIAYNRPTTNIELSRSGEDFTGNYQTHNIPLSALHRSAEWEELEIKPQISEVATDLGVTIYTDSLSIPVKVKYDFFYRLRRTYLRTLLLALCLFFIGLGDNIFKKDGMTIWLTLAYIVASSVAAILKIQ